MERLLISKRIQCINCNICVNSVNSQKRYLVINQSLKVVTLISEWISPVIITEEDYICEACYYLAMKTINGQIDGNNVTDWTAGPSQHGHKKVCLLCGRSLVNKRSHWILSNTSPFELEMIQLIETRVAPRPISTSDHLCHACYMRVKRHAIRNEAHDDTPVAGATMKFETVLVDSSAPAETPADFESHADFDQHIKTKQDASEVPVNKSKSPETRVDPQTQPPRPPDIYLPNYKRAPNTASHCIFSGCNNIFNLRIVPNPLRRTLLIKHKFYVPIHAKVCSEHLLLKNYWHSLYDAENSLSNFTAAQIEHMLSFLNVDKPLLDLSNMPSQLTDRKKKKM